MTTAAAGIRGDSNPPETHLYTIHKDSRTCLDRLHIYTHIIINLNCLQRFSLYRQTHWSLDTEWTGSYEWTVE